jgi:hypothetical protein
LVDTPTNRRREWTSQPGKQKLFAVLDWNGKTVKSRIGSRVGDKIIAPSRQGVTMFVATRQQLLLPVMVCVLACSD